jgi:IclR family acetate operon transcriptional repressor
MPAHTGTQAIDRAAQLLVLVAESREPAGVGDLAQATGLPKSTVSRLVSALERHGLVQRDGSRGRVRPGPVLLRLARRGLGARDLGELSAGALERLAAASGETINLAVPSPLGVEHLAQIDSRHFLGSTNWVGRRVPHHATAAGKVFLAFGAARLPQGALSRLTPHTITERRALEESLGAVRRGGYATAVDELEPGLAAVGAPVRGSDGRVVAALSISGPTLRLAPGRLDELAPLLLAESDAVSARLGYTVTTEGAA